jgi:NAD+ kinase
MTIAIFSSSFRPKLINIIQPIFDYLKKHKVDILLEKALFEYLQEESVDCSGMKHVDKTDDFHADLALSIGGDGTFLHTAAFIGDKNIPVLGINTGRLGFLADVPGTDILMAMEAIIQNQLFFDERTLLTVTCSDNRSIELPNVLNDISVLKQDSSSMISINTWLNGEAVNTYHADGLIISTPTGSTAYSMSAGGPLMVPQSANIILSPVATHSLTVRPLVIPDDWVIDLEIISRSGSYQVSLDGRSMVLEDSVRLKISKAPYKVLIARQMNHTFFKTLKNKLMWGIDKRN